MHLSYVFNVFFLSCPLKAELKPETDGEAAEMSVCAVTAPSTLPLCDTGCTENKLGLLNIEPERDIWDLLRVSCSYRSPRQVQGRHDRGCLLAHGVFLSYFVVRVVNRTRVQERRQFAGGC